MGWWQKVFGKSTESKASGGKSSPPNSQSREEAVRWMSADEAGNPFGVPLLNLMSNLQLISTTQDPAMASRAVSWRAGEQDRLRWELEGESFDCSFEYVLEAHAIAHRECPWPPRSRQGTGSSGRRRARHEQDGRRSRYCSQRRQVRRGRLAGETLKLAALCSASLEHRSALFSERGQRFQPVFALQAALVGCAFER
jgi:hypothetical protein